MAVGSDARLLRSPSGGIISLTTQSLDPQEGGSDAGVLVDAAGGVGALALAKCDAATLEVAEELFPLSVARGAVLFAGAGGRAAGDEGPGGLGSPLLGSAWARSRCTRVPGRGRGDRQPCGAGSGAFTRSRRRHWLGRTFSWIRLHILTMRSGNGLRQGCVRGTRGAALSAQA